MSSPLVPLSEALTEFNETLGTNAEPTVLTLTEGRGFMAQSERFGKRLAVADTSNYKVIRKGDLAFNPYLLWAGAVAHNDQFDSGLISPLYPTFRARDQVDARYIWQMLRSPDALSRFDRISFGSVPRKRRASTRDFLSVKIPLPPLPEQRRIASILDAADQLRYLNRRTAEFGRDLDQQVFRSHFSSNSDASGTVTDVLADVPNAIRTGPFGSQLLHSEFVSEGVAVLGIDSTLGNRFHDSGVRFITEEKYEKLRRYTVRPGDVLITIMGTIGRTAVVPESIGPSINTKHLCCITTDKKICLPEYLQYYFLYHPVARDYLSRASKGSIMDGLNMGLIKSLPVVLPTLNQQKRFVSILKANRALTELQKQRAAVADELFASLQHRAFTGQL